MSSGMLRLVPDQRSARPNPRPVDPNVPQQLQVNLDWSAVNEMPMSYATTFACTVPGPGEVSSASRPGCGSGISRNASTATRSYAENKIDSRHARRKDNDQSRAATRTYNGASRYSKDSRRPASRDLLNPGKVHRYDNCLLLTSWFNA